MNRDDVRLMAYGKFASMNLESQTIDKDKMLNFSEGVIYGHDLGQRDLKREVTISTPIFRTYNYENTTPYHYENTTTTTTEITADEDQV